MFCGNAHSPQCRHPQTAPVGCSDVHWSATVEANSGFQSPLEELVRDLDAVRVEVQAQSQT